MTKVETKTNEKNKVPEYKKKVVEDLANDIRNSQTILVASTKNLPGSQFHEIKKKLRGKAIIKVAKKSLVLRAFGMVEKGALQHLKEKIVADVALFFSNLDAFELSSLLSDNLSPAKAKMGDIAPEDISIEPGPTNMIPGPAISELSSVGLKVAVENGKIAIKQGATVVKKGERVPEKVVGVLAKLNILPMRVGFEPIAAYDSKSDMVYSNIKIDKKEALEKLRESIGKALGFAVNMKYSTKETIVFFIAKAGAEEKVILNLVNKHGGTQWTAYPILRMN